jgi:hypothetical protein
MASSLALADVLPLPTFAVDYVYLGLPLGLFAGAALLALVGFFARSQRKAGRGWPRVILLSALLFAAGNFVCYLVATGSGVARNRRLEPGPPGGMLVQPVQATPAGQDRCNQDR